MPNPLDISKALDTTSTSTGNVLIPSIVEAGIRKYFETRTPIWNQIRKRPTLANSYVYKEQLSIPVASFGAEMGSLPSAQNSTYVERAIPMKSIYSRGEISGQEIAATRAFIDVADEEIRNHTLAVINAIETTLVIGDSAARPNEFDGMVKWITNEVFVDSVGDGTGTDSPLVLDHLNLLLDAPRYSTVNALIMNAETKRRLWSVLQPQVRYVGEGSIDGGFTVPTFNDIPILIVKPNSAATGADLNGLILAVNTELMHIPILQELTYEELAHTRDSVDFFLKMYLGFVVEGGAFHHAKLSGFSTVID